MKIRNNSNYIFSNNISCPLQKSKVSPVVQNDVIPITKIPLNSIKANFVPNFGKYRKVKDIKLLDRDTEMLVRASLVKDSIGDYSSYKIMVGRKEAGYMDMDTASFFPRSAFPQYNYLNEIPEVKHLRSLMGDRFYGIGTELINTAIEESIKKGKGGRLWLSAEQGYASNYSTYRQDENPIPFYYKLGFRAIDDKYDKVIKDALEKQEYEKLPEEATLVLSAQGLYNFNKYYCSHFSYNL